METGEWPEARADLRKAQECDPTVKAEVAKQLRELAKRISAQDKKDMKEIGVRLPHLLPSFSERRSLERGVWLTRGAHTRGG
jgi:phage-related protein